MTMDYLKALIKVIIICIIMLGHIVKGDNRISQEHRLYNDLFTDYNTNIRPVRNENNTIQVTLTFSLEHLDGLDAQKQLLRVSGWLAVDWYDEFLTWDEVEYGGVDRIVVPPQKVWIPDFALDNSAGDVYDLKHYNFFRVTVFSDGNVGWSPGGKFECICTVDIQYYPFDRQVCQLVFANWEYVGRHVNLSIGDPIINLDKYPGNGEWEVVRTEAVRFADAYACCPEDIFPEIHFIMYMQRKSLYYVINVLLPVLFLSLLELLIFILPCDSGEKISLGITIMLGFSVFALLIEESVPNTSEATPVIVMYLTAAMGTAAISVVCSVFILAIHHHDCNISPPVRLLKFAKYRLCGNDANPVTKSLSTDQRNGHLSREGNNDNRSENNKLTYLENGLTVVPQNSYDKQNHSNLEFEDVNSKLHYVVTKMGGTNDKARIHDEWKTVAKALDRTLFKCVSTVLMILAIVILGILPLTMKWPVITL